MRIATLVRAMRPADLLLPVGAALVSAGLSALTDREVRQRARLDELQHLVEIHRDALVAADVVLPLGVLVDEQHPLDVETLPTVFPGHAPTAAAPDETPRRGRGWKLAALALAGVVGVTLYGNRGRLFDALLPDDGSPSRFGFAMPWPPAAAEPENFPPAAAAPAAGGPSSAAAAAAETPVTEDLPAGDGCGWPGCDHVGTVDGGAALALHRQRCLYRPAGAHVPEA